jgi:hypothetical protein
LRLHVLVAVLIILTKPALGQQWGFQEDDDKITKERRSIAFVSAVNWDRAYGFRAQNGPELFLVCKKQGLQAYVSWEALISCGDIGVEYRTPKGSVVRSRWTGATDCKANFIRDAKLFMRGLGEGGDLPLRYTPRTGKITEIDWRFPDPKPIREKMPQHCKW